MKSIVLFLLIILKSVAFSQSFIDTFLTFTPTAKEIGCMKHFQPSATEYSAFNNYILAKMSETMYAERLDYMYRFFQNNRKPVDSIPSTGWLKRHPILNDSNFERAFINRFQHMFQEEDSVQFKFLQKTKYIQTLRGKESTIGFDPELIVISTTSYVIIVYRGTDMMEENIRGEWIGTDFNLFKTKKSNYFEKGRVHRGFLKSTELIHPYLEEYLTSINAKKKPVWVTGHSLGGSMAIISAARLHQLGYTIPRVNVYGTPNSIVNKRFITNSNPSFIAKIYRHEFYLDPFPMLWSPGYASFGHRTWILPDWSMMAELPHRSFKKRKWKCRECTEEMQLKLEYAMRKNFFKLPTEIHHHNPQWYTKALVHYLSEEEKQNCPDIDDSFPFIYYGWDEAR